MATRVSLTSTAEGDLVVIKTALSGDRNDRRAEAQWLADAAQIESARPLAVTLEGIDDDPFVSIVTHRRAGDTLRTLRASPAQAASVLIETIEVLLELHRHGLVHGKLTLDHIIVAGEGPVLCSPLGTANDPTADALGLAGCIRSLLLRWEDDSIEVPDGDAWIELADRLGDDDNPMPLRRAARRLRSLAAEDARPDVVPDSPTAARVSRSGAALIAVVTMVAVGALGFTGPGSTGAEGAATAPGPTVTVDGHRYRIGQAGDEVVALEARCPGQPAVVFLQTRTGELWAFDDVADIAGARYLTTVDGAADLHLDGPTAAGPAACLEVSVTDVDGDRIVVPVEPAD